MEFICRLKKIWTAIPLGVERKAIKNIITVFKIYVIIYAALGYSYTEQIVHLTLSEFLRSSAFYQLFLSFAYMFYVMWVLLNLIFSQGKILGKTGILFNYAGPKGIVTSLLTSIVLIGVLFNTAVHELTTKDNFLTISVIVFLILLGLKISNTIRTINREDIQEIRRRVGG